VDIAQVERGYDPDAIRAALVNFTVSPNHAQLRPGQPCEFVWAVNRYATLGWNSATIEVGVLTDAGEIRPIYSRSHRFPLPLSGLHPPPGAWPPYGAVTETLTLDVEGRPLMYNGFGTRQLQITLTPAGADDEVYIDQVIWEIIPEPNISSWASFDLPMVADWNVSYPFSIDVSTDAWASMAATIAVVEEDSTGGTTATYSGLLPIIPVGANLPVGRTADVVWTQSSIVHSWRWVIKPEYHAEDDLRSRAMAYSATITWTDEFGNRYDGVSLPHGTVIVRVNDQKWTAAAIAEALFWLFLAIAAAALIAVATLGIASGATAASAAALSGALAIWAAGVAAAAGIVAGIATFAIGEWQMFADDPPAPDPQFWVVEDVAKELDDVLTGAAALMQESGEVQPSATTALTEAIRFGHLAGLASRATSRMLGAQTAGVDSAVKLQLGAISDLRRQLIASASRIQEFSGAIFLNAPSANDLKTKLQEVKAKLTEMKKVPAKVRRAANADLDQALLDCDRGAAVLANSKVLKIALDTVTSSVISELDVWLAPHSGAAT
jgi:hypothetical protein